MTTPQLLYPFTGSPDAIKGELSLAHSSVLVELERQTGDLKRSGAISPEECDSLRNQYRAQINEELKREFNVKKSGGKFSERILALQFAGGAEQFVRELLIQDDVSTEQVA